MAFEIGNADLREERGDGWDISLRHDSSRLRAEWNLFSYSLHDVVYMSPTGDIEDGLQVVHFQQGNALYHGSEARLDLGLHPSLWLNLGMDAVRAKLRDVPVSLPRIPPARFRAGFDLRWRGLSLRPELLLSGARRKVYSLETATAGFALVHLAASYTVPHPHWAQVFSVSAFNLGNRLYRNHSSFIKDLAPEMGRGIRFHYSFHFF
jgi:iron complex outermembrane recepter protein